MVKPLNKEWELFGRKYRVAGAKVDKVDCNACGKQVSAAVNRLQSHLRVCFSRPVLPPALAAQVHGRSHSHSNTHSQSPGSSFLDAGPAAFVGDAVADADNSEPAASTAASTTTNMTSTTDPSHRTKRQKTTPTPTPTAKSSPTPTHSPRGRDRDRDRDRQRLNAAIEELLAHSSPSLPLPVPPPHARARLEIEEKRLALELRREQREQRRDALQVEILEAKARQQRLVAEKEAFETRVLLGLSRKQLRDQGVDEHEIDRLLPIEPLVGATTEPTELQAMEPQPEPVPTLPQSLEGGEAANGTASESDLKPSAVEPLLAAAAQDQDHDRGHGRVITEPETSVTRTTV